MTENEATDEKETENGRPAINQEEEGRVSKYILYRSYNARLHTANDGKEKREEMGHDDMQSPETTEPLKEHE